MMSEWLLQWDELERRRVRRCILPTLFAAAYSILTADIALAAPENRAETGGQYCERHTNWPDVCYPIKNISETDILQPYFVAHGVYGPLLPGDVIAVYTAYPGGQTRVLIYDSTGTELLHDVYVQNWLGLECDTVMCRPWN